MHAFPADGGDKVIRNQAFYISISYMACCRLKSKPFCTFILTVGGDKIIRNQAFCISISYMAPVAPKKANFFACFPRRRRG
ncbi:MAG: hypothetical protein LBR79_03600 [Oscillospiraceae bacterium]|nr:hypothetical protein [Oscillospiraceae bacterium]